MSFICHIHNYTEYNEEWNVLTHPSVHTWSSGQPTVQRPGSSHGLPVGARIRTHNLGLPRVSSPTLYPLGQRLPNRLFNTFNIISWPYDQNFIWNKYLDAYKIYINVYINIYIFTV